MSKPAVGQEILCADACSEPLPDAGAKSPSDVQQGGSTEGTHLMYLLCVFLFGFRGFCSYTDMQA